MSKAKTLLPFWAFMACSRVNVFTTLLSCIILHCKQGSVAHALILQMEVYGESDRTQILNTILFYLLHSNVCKNFLLCSQRLILTQ
jgi:hypothetical protein